MPEVQLIQLLHFLGKRRKRSRDLRRRTDQCIDQNKGCKMPSSLPGTKYHNNDVQSPDWTHSDAQLRCPSFNPRFHGHEKFPPPPPLIALQNAPAPEAHFFRFAVHPGCRITPFVGPPLSLSGQAHYLQCPVVVHYSNSQKKEEQFRASQLHCSSWKRKKEK
jgi:hypothetical protein